VAERVADAAECADMTRGVRPGSLARTCAGAGPGIDRGPFTPVAIAPALVFSRHPTWCTGQICLWCDQPIHGHGVRWSILADVVQFRTHPNCARATLRAME
jgi:hypothetical protein